MKLLEDPARDACYERCAQFGDPPCYEICEGPWQPCEHCLRDIGIEPDEPIDPAAVVRPLL